MNIALAAIVGFTTFGCKNDDDGGSGDFGKIDSSLNGEWKGDETNGTLKIDGDKWDGGTKGKAKDIADQIKVLQETTKQSNAAGSMSLEIGDEKIVMKIESTVANISVEAVYYTYKINGKTLTITYGDDADYTGEAFKGTRD